MVGGTLVSQQGFVDYYICTNDSTQNQVQTVLTNNTGFFTTYFIHDQAGVILSAEPGPDFDFSTFQDGRYYITAATHNGQLFNGVIGSNMSGLGGCFALSSSFIVVKQLVQAGTIDIDGATSIDLCGSEAMSLMPNNTGSLGTNLNWVVTNDQGVILNVFTSLPINVSNLTEQTLLLRLISYVGRIDGLDVNENFDNISGCFDVSNTITITNEGVFGGVINVGNETDVFVCLNNCYLILRLFLHYFDL